MRITGYDWKWGIDGTGDEFAAIEQDALRRLAEAQLELAAAQVIVQHLQQLKAWSTLSKGGISASSHVVVRYSDGDEDAVLVDVVDSMKPIVLRTISARGRPHKRTHNLEADMADFIELKK